MLTYQPDGNTWKDLPPPQRGPRDYTSSPEAPAGIRQPPAPGRTPAAPAGAYGPGWQQQPTRLPTRAGLGSPSGRACAACGVRLPPRRAAGNRGNFPGYDPPRRAAAAGAARVRPVPPMTRRGC